MLYSSCRDIIYYVPTGRGQYKFLFTVFLITGFCFGGTIVYENDPSNFPNPERGYAYVNDPPWAPEIKWSFCGCENYDWDELTEALNPGVLTNWRDQGWSLVFVRYHLSAFRSTSLPQAFLDHLQTDFNTVRAAGFKLVPRFTYNWPMGGPDATLERVLSHIEQIKPLLTDNVDVIAYMDLGFIGCWGENHTSCNGLVDGSNPNENSYAILESLLAALPAERMVAVRYPKWKFRYFGNANDAPIEPLTESEAYSGSMKARWAHHDDCPVCGEWNCGTWQTQRQDASEMMDFLSLDNRYLLQSGEPGDPETGVCNLSGDADGDGWGTDQHADCDRVLWQFEKARWSAISGFYGENPNNRAYQIWKEQGCYETIGKRLGYRFRLVSAEFPEPGTAQSSLQMSFTIANDGWASPYNPRVLEIILHNTENGNVFPVVIKEGSGRADELTHDPRFWHPGEETVVQIDVSLPAGIPSGEYEVLLNLPDPHPSLNDRPEYSIRLANQGVWEEETGYNDLNMSITVLPTSTAVNRPTLRLAKSLWPENAEHMDLRIFDLLGRSTRVLNINNRLTIHPYIIKSDREIKK
jgi:hypothetical protein